MPLNLTSGDQPTGGQLTANTTAAPLATSQSCSCVLVQNDPGSSVNVLVGGSAAQYLQLTPGQSISIPTSNLNLVYVKTGSSTATVNYIYIF